MPSALRFLLGLLLAVGIIALIWYFTRSKKRSKRRKTPGGEKTARASKKEE